MRQLICVCTIQINLCCLIFTSAVYAIVHLRVEYITETNIINPNQTAPKEAILFWSILFPIKAI